MPGLRSIFLRLEPPTTATALKVFRRIGHGRSIDAGRIPESGIEWYAALSAGTRTRENDLTMFGRIRPRDRLTSQDLAKIRVRSSFFWGTGDVFGGRPVAEALTAMLPDARLEVVENAGHLPWLDAPGKAGRHVRAFFQRA